MDGLVFTLFAVAALLGGFVSGFSGFAMGLVVSGVWLHIIPPMQTATLIAGYGLLTQGYGVFKLRHSLNLQKAWPLAVGTILGIPVGVSILAYFNPAYLRFCVGMHWRCMQRVSRSWSPAFGPDSNCLEKSTTRCSERLCRCFCCSRVYR